MFEFKSLFKLKVNLVKISSVGIIIIIITMLFQVKISTVQNPFILCNVVFGS